MKYLALIVLTLVASTTGCSMCCGPFDYDYPTFGGKHLRADRAHGRVGSILSDPATMLSGPSADSNLAAPPELLESMSDDDDSYESDRLDADKDENLRELEGIEPLRNGGGLNEPAKDSADDTTASNRWRPRSLR
ncbi:hypothetical protein [Mariniblastus fucicola]|uniref:Lipoprotein n=1 Tax=Mariniblastus fucicola TaxID=980251 RepID=A0A5B9PB33_9BACT|nr:hypothetical protein [Mariniblastus fucicola]QEG22395.1 hypothetical protein MFFC18_22750 [Mariniblastus fucicola]